jgi:peroxiredoxin
LICKVELGELEKHHQEFASRNVRVVVVSNDDPSDAKKTQAEFPHLVVVSDAEQKLAKAMQVIHAGAGRHHDDTNAPTTFLLDGGGHVRGVFRSDYFLVRQSAAELLTAIDSTLPKS